MSQNEEHDEPAPEESPAEESSEQQPRHPRREFLRRLGTLGLGHFAFSMLGGKARAEDDVEEVYCGDPLPDGTVVRDTNCGKTVQGGVAMDSSCGLPAGTSPTWVYNDLDCNGPTKNPDGSTGFWSDGDCAEPTPNGTVYSDEGCLRSNPARPGSVWGDSDCGKPHLWGQIHGDQDCGHLKHPVGRHTDEDCGVPNGASDDRCALWTDFGDQYEDGDCGQTTDYGGVYTDNLCYLGQGVSYVDSDCALTGYDSNPPPDAEG